MSQSLSGKTGMDIARLMEIIDIDGNLMVRIWRKGLSEEEYTLEALTSILECASKIVGCLRKHKNTPAEIAEKARSIYSLWNGGIYPRVVPFPSFERKKRFVISELQTNG